MTTYGVRIFQAGRDEDVNLVRHAMATELQALGLHTSVTVAVTEAELTDDRPYVGVYLAGPEAVDDAIRDAVLRTLADGVVVIPVVVDLGEFHDLVPEYLEHTNAVQWSDGADLARIIRILLEELGIEEQQRRVFISHKRDDGLGAAEQLHDVLSHHRFKAFIDRFSIGPGQRVQAEIANALEDHAFLLLLETPLAHTSEWVFDEVDYALSHTMGILILRWPGEPQPVPGSPGVPRLQLRADELVTDEHGYEVLTSAGLDRVIAEVEAAHAWGLARRRRLIVQSIEEAALASGASSCTPLRDWRLLVQQPNVSTVVATTPRLPTPRDLQALDTAALAMPGSPARLLVHSARSLQPELRVHLGWVVGEREITVMPENAVGGWW